MSSLQDVTFLIEIASCDLIGLPLFGDFLGQALGLLDQCPFGNGYLPDFSVQVRDLGFGLGEYREAGVIEGLPALLAFEYLEGRGETLQQVQT